MLGGRKGSTASKVLLCDTAEAWDMSSYVVSSIELSNAENVSGRCVLKLRGRLGQGEGRGGFRR